MIEDRSRKRINKAIAGYKGALMNDTKWREFLDLVGRHEILIQFSFVREERFRSVTTFPEGGTEGDHTKDCTAHGPFLLREIFAIKCIRPEGKRDFQRGRRCIDETRDANFMASLRCLGQLSITEDADGVIVNGYQK